MKNNICKNVVLIAVVSMSLFGSLFGSGCARNVPWVKEHARPAAEQLGYDIIGYEGYEWSLFVGGMVWYTMSRHPDNGVIYHAGFVKWGDEVHIYNLKAIDAIKHN